MTTDIPDHEAARRTPPKIRTRTGSWNTFNRRFKPRESVDGAVLVEPSDLPTGIDAHKVWTVIDEDGHLYLFPGFRFVNRFAYVICNVHWNEGDMLQPPYHYD